VKFDAAVEIREIDGEQSIATHFDPSQVGVTASAQFEPAASGMTRARVPVDNPPWGFTSSTTSIPAP
jgi:hypothetical protein